MEKKTGSYPPLLIVLFAGICLAAAGAFLAGVFRGGAADTSLIPREPLPEAPERQTAPFGERGAVPETERGWGETTKAPETGAAFPGIRARVRDALTGEVVQSLRAWVFESGEGDPEQLSRSDPGKVFNNTMGVLTFTGLDDGTYTLLVRSSGYRDLVVPDMRAPQTRSMVDLAISRGTHIAGTVTDAAGRPVADIVVLIKCFPFNPDDSPPPRTTDVTDAQGRYLLGDLPPGRYELYIEEQGVEKLAEAYLDREDAFIHDFIVPDYNRLKFVVTLPGGRPLPDAHVRLASEADVFTVRTSAAGEAYLNRVPPGEYDLEIYKSRFKTHREKVSLKCLSGDWTYDRLLELDR